jgi:hypothetical protein
LERGRGRRVSGAMPSEGKRRSEPAEAGFMLPATGQGLTLAHFTDQLEDLRDTSLMLELNWSTFGPHPRLRWVLWGTKLKLLKLSGKGQGELEFSGNGNECKSLSTGCAEMKHAAALLGRGLHSFTLELDLSHSRTHSWFKLGYTVDGRAQVELQWERVYAPAARLHHRGARDTQGRRLHSSTFSST